MLAAQLLGFRCVTPTYSPEEFCLALKAVRERKGITLLEISNATKIPVSVFAALERGDLRRWPKGLFKKSFFGGYAKFIGVPVAETCAEFMRLFPDEEPAEVTPLAQVPDSTNQENMSPLSRIIATAMDAISNVLGNVSGSDNTDEPETRGWVTDARRVGPAPRIRVRIKVPK